MLTPVSRHGERYELTEIDGDITIYHFEGIDKVASWSSSSKQKQLKPVQVLVVGQASAARVAPGDNFLNFSLALLGHQGWANQRRLTVTACS